MILLVDSGSTKADWVILDAEFNQILVTSTIGLNPYIVTEEIIFNELSLNKQLNIYKEKIDKVFFYGAGCSSTESNYMVEKLLNIFFSNAKVIIKNDLYSAAYSCYQGEKCIVGILGTGSNACYFDGDNIRLDFTSLGYIFGDYGGGSFLGKNLMIAFAENKLPNEIKNKLIKEYNISVNSILENVYFKKFPNRYLASFAPFILKNIDNFFIYQVVYDSFVLFFKNYILIYPEALNVKINMVGSIAFNFKEILIKTATEKNLTIGNIVHKPINSLVNYHKKYLNY